MLGSAEAPSQQAVSNGCRNCCDDKKGGRGFGCEIRVKTQGFNPNDWNPSDRVNVNMDGC